MRLWLCFAALLGPVHRAASQIYLVQPACFESNEKPFYARTSTSHFDATEVHGRLQVPQTAPTWPNQYIAFMPPLKRTCAYMGLDLSIVADARAAKLEESGSLHFDVTSVYPTGSRKEWDKHTQNFLSACQTQNHASTLHSIADNIEFVEHGFQHELRQAENWTLPTWHDAANLWLDGKHIVKQAGKNAVAATLFHGSCPHGSHRIPFVGVGDVCTDAATGKVYKTIRTALRKVEDATAVTLAVVQFQPKNAAAHAQLQKSASYIGYRLRARCLLSSNDAQIGQALSDAAKKRREAFNSFSTRAMNSVAPQPTIADHTMRFVSHRLYMSDASLRTISAQQSLGVAGKNIQESWTDGRKSDLFGELWSWWTAFVVTISALLAVLSRCLGRTMFCPYGFVYYWLAFLYTAEIFQTLATDIICNENTNSLDRECHVYIVLHYFGIVCLCSCVVKFIGRGCCPAAHVRDYQILPTRDDDTATAQKRLHAAKDAHLEHEWRYQCCNKDCMLSQLHKGVKHGISATKQSGVCCEKVVARLGTCCFPCISCVVHVVCFPYSLVMLSLFATYALRNADGHVHQKLSDSFLYATWATWASVSLIAACISSSLAFLLWQSGAATLDIVCVSLLAFLGILTIVKCLESQTSAVVVFLSRIFAALLHGLFLRCLAMTGWLCPVAFVTVVVVLYLPLTCLPKNANDGIRTRAIYQ